MIDLDKITRDFVKACVLNEEFDASSDVDLILENGDFIKGSLGAQIQNIFEVIDGVRLTSNRDRNRMSLARENMKKVKFAKAITANEVRKENFIYSFLSSIRQKMETKRK